MTADVVPFQTTTFFDPKICSCILVRHLDNNNALSVNEDEDSDDDEEDDAFGGSSKKKENDDDPVASMYKVARKGLRL